MKIERERALARRSPERIAKVEIGRHTGTVEVFSDGITRLRVPHIPTFYSRDDWTPLEHAAFRKQRRAIIRQLIAAIEQRVSNEQRNEGFRD